MASQKFNNDENPFAFNYEKTEEGRSGPVFTDYENPFAYPAQNTTTTAAAGAGAGNSDRSAEKNWTLIKLQRWNTILRIATFCFCLAAFILTLSSRQTSSHVPLDDGSKGRGTATYKFNGSFVFFLYVNIVVCLYALLLSASAFVMGRKGKGQTTPTSLMWPAFVLNVITASFLLLAFAAALAVAVVSNRGLSLGGIIWEPICHYFKMFCFFIEIALGLCALAFLSLVAGTSIDGYCIYLHKILSD